MSYYEFLRWKRSQKNNNPTSEMWKKLIDERDHLEQENKELRNKNNNLNLQYSGWDSMLNRVKELCEENAKLKRLLATACYLLEHTYNDIPTTIRDNNELKQWYEEHKKENK